MNDSTYPWLVLVPERNDIREIHELSEIDGQTLLREITLVSSRIQKLFKADKMNVAALGNMVPQLHVHIIARYDSDPAWPSPIWGATKPVPYNQQVLDNTLEKIKEALK